MAVLRKSLQDSLGRRSVYRSDITSEITDLIRWLEAPTPRWAFALGFYLLLYLAGKRPQQLEGLEKTVDRLKADSVSHSEEGREFRERLDTVEEDGGDLAIRVEEIEATIGLSTDTPGSDDSTP